MHTQTPPSNLGPWGRVSEASVRRQTTTASILLVRFCNLSSISPGCRPDHGLQYHSRLWSASELTPFDIRGKGHEMHGLRGFQHAESKPLA
jgi:hypothetical protein